MLLCSRVNCKRVGLKNKPSKMFLAKMSNDLQLVCAHGANSKRLRLKLNLRKLSLSNQLTWLYASGKHLCKSYSSELSQVNTLRWRSILVNWRDVTHRPCAWSTRKRQLQALHEVGQLYGRGWRCQERKLVKWQLRMRKKKHFILTAVICQNGILTRKQFIWNQIGI